MGARGRRRKPPEQSSAAASSPELAVRPLQGLVWVEVGCKMTSSAWVVRWGTQGKGLGRGTPCAAAMAGERGGASPGRAPAASGVRYRLKHLAQKYGGAIGGAHRPGISTGGNGAGVVVGGPRGLQA